jgi:hypothetical protein
MQILYETGLTAKEYIEQRAWEQATLDRCPFHPKGGCSFAKHGTYSRKFPEFFLIARWYCPEAHRSVSLLPECFACRFPGTLNDIEEAVASTASYASHEQAAAELRPDITLPSALRWLRRRLKHVIEILTTVKGIIGMTCPPALASWRHYYATQNLLQHLRLLMIDHLHALPPILGFRPRSLLRYFTKPPSNNQWGLSSIS